VNHLRRSVKPHVCHMIRIRASEIKSVSLGGLSLLSALRAFMFVVSTTKDWELVDLQSVFRFLGRAVKVTGDGSSDSGKDSDCLL
jgi:hypothetical protein